MFTPTVFEILMSEGRGRYYHPLSGVQGAKGLSNISWFGNLIDYEQLFY